MVVVHYQNIPKRELWYATYPMKESVSINFNKEFTMTVFDNKDGYITPILTGSICSPTVQLHTIIDGQTIRFENDTTYFDELVHRNNTTSDSGIFVSCTPFTDTNALPLKKIDIIFDKFIYDRYLRQFVKESNRNTVRTLTPVKFIEESKASTLTMPVTGRARSFETNTFDIFGIKMTIGTPKMRHGVAIRTTPTDGNQSLLNPFDATLISVKETQHGGLLNPFTLTKFEFVSSYFVPNDYSICPSLSYLPGQTKISVNSYHNPGTDSEMLMQEPLMCNKNADDLLYNMYVAGPLTRTSVKPGTMLYKDEQLGKLDGPTVILIMSNRPIIWNRVSRQFDTYIRSGDFIGNFA